MSYNGWSNYQTWNVALWLGNDENVYRYTREIAATNEYKLTSKDAENIVKEVWPRGTPDLRDRIEPYDGVEWSSIAAYLNER